MLPPFESDQVDDIRCEAEKPLLPLASSPSQGKRAETGGGTLGTGKPCGEALNDPKLREVTMAEGRIAEPGLSAPRRGEPDATSPSDKQARRQTVPGA